MNELTDKVVLITGAGKGCGRLLAEALARHGACVAANDISPVNVDELVTQITQQGGRAKAYVEDVAKKLGAQLIINQVEDDFGQIDILINHAAVEPHVPLLEMDEWDWHRVLDVNLTGAFLMTQSVGRVMRANGGGVIINLIPESVRDESSTRTPEEWRRRRSHRDYSEPSRNEAAFVASMSGLRGFTQQAARELSPYGIHVHAVESDREQVVESVLALLEREER